MKITELVFLLLTVLLLNVSSKEIITITIDTLAKFKVPPVSPNFVGFSIEVSDVLGMIGDIGQNAPYAQLLANLARMTEGNKLGPVLRLGIKC